MMDEYDEKYLVQQLRDGSEEVFARLYSIYKEPVFRYFFMFLKSYDLASDLTQQVFIAIWLNKANIDSSQAFNAYLFTTAQNKLRNHIRELKRDKQKLETWVETAEVAESSSEYKMILEEYNLHLKKAVERLSEQKQLVFNLRLYQGKSYNEISKLIGLSTNTVRNHLVESKKLLKQYLAPFLAD